MPDDPFQIPRSWALERGKAGAAVMKIGVITHNYPRFRGDFSGRFVESLSEALVTFGHKVTVLAPWDPAYAPCPQTMASNWSSIATRRWPGGIALAMPGACSPIYACVA